MNEIITSINTMWILIGTVLVFFMQAGFAMVETGFTRAKNAGNIIMKNLMDFACGTIVFWLLGFGLMFAENNGFIGGLQIFIGGDGVDYATLMFQTVFCATAATIVSGAMAERTKFSSYLIYSIVISLVIYPISGHWIWGGGWLSALGFHDFAGSTAVHMVGGVAALCGAKILGPRIGKFGKDGKPKAITGHSLTLGALGVFILWFCWFGFNGGSTVAMDGDNAMLASKVFYTTNLAAATATVATMIFTWIKYKKPDVSMTLNGSLAGLVAITAGCDLVEPWAAAVIGVIAGIVVVLVVELMDKVLKIDDPVGAVAVHCACGALGTLLTGIFANADAGLPGGGGLVYTGNFTFVGVQLLGIITVAAWVAVTMSIVFLTIKHTVGLRVTAEEEIKGLDLTEHGLVSAYGDFMPAFVALESDSEKTEMDDAVPVILKENKMASDLPMTKVEVICPQNRFEALKNSLDEIGVTGMTVTNVLGCGIQKGQYEYYRGVKTNSILLPKIQVEVVVCKVPVDTVVKTIKKVLYTGHIGDGKIFVYDVKNVIKVRTGEEGYDALQND